MSPFDVQSIANALADAAVDRTRWQAALETVASHTNSYGAVLLPLLGAMPMVSAALAMEEISDRYVSEGWIDRDERYRGSSWLLANGVMTDDNCMPVEHRKRSPFYQDFLHRNGLGEHACVRIGRGPQVWSLSIQRTPAQGAFSRAELSCLAQLADRLDAIAEVSMALGFARGEAALDAYQFSSRAAVLLDRAGEVVRANGAAEALFAQGDGLQMSRGRIVSSDPKATERLNLAIKTLLWSRTNSLESPLVLTKATGGKVVIYPMRLSGLTESPLSAFHAILVIVDTDAPRALIATTLRAAFDLTPAESRLATAIANGQDLASFAAGALLSKETVRNQLKSIFQKTGTRRQSELTALLATLVPNQ